MCKCVAYPFWIIIVSIAVGRVNTGRIEDTVWICLSGRGRQTASVTVHRRGWMGSVLGSTVVHSVHRPHEWPWDVLGEARGHIAGQWGGAIVGAVVILQGHLFYLADYVSHWGETLAVVILGLANGERRINHMSTRPTDPSDHQSA